ncbi:dicer-2 protein [Spinellus fusiger]|nr:dicer-2 protein [Spinellus fusiger]
MTPTVEDIDYEEGEENGIHYVGPEPLLNDMNEHNEEWLLKYLDPEFLNITPDSKAKDMDLIRLEEKFGVDDLDEETEETEETSTVAMLCPREYQYELYLKALEENVIAVLDTGSGKTLIAVMLIKEIARLEREARMTRRFTKLTFFLVDRVPLVFQQAEVIRSNCDVVLEQMCGEMNVDNWSEKKWRTTYEESDVCVMTAQIFLDTLRHGFISLSSVNLLIFDECHHATKKHPYNLIMREFYDRCSVQDRPKIFGMTASPMHSKTGILNSTALLESNLNSRIYTATNLDELKAVVKLPNELEFRYNPYTEYEPTPLTTFARERLGKFERFNRIFVSTTAVARHLGSWCSDRLWQFSLSTMVERMVVDTKGRSNEDLCSEDQALYEVYSRSIEAAPPNPSRDNKALFSPKIIGLLQVLYVFLAKEDFCGIIFVERRQTAIAINLLIRSISDLKPFKCDILIGHGAHNEGDVKMRFKDQNNMIKKFRTGELNLLIATNVAEEGLDIQPCNVVIRFDFFTTLIAYIQSRGRARKEDSKYIIFTDASNKQQIDLLGRFRILENEMKVFCQSMPEERNLATKFLRSNTNYEKSLFQDEENDEDCDTVFIVPSTGAMITVESSVALLHRYCSTLPSDQFSVLKPVFEITRSNQGFQCTVLLPSNAAITDVTSEPTQTKSMAKKLAALEACIQLYGEKVFDEHLMPHNARRELLGEMAPQFDKNGMIIGSRRRRGVYEKRIPKFWNRVRRVEEEDQDKDKDKDKENKQGIEAREVDDVFNTNPETALMNIQPKIRPELRREMNKTKTVPVEEEIEDVDGLLKSEAQEVPVFQKPLLEEEDNGPFTLWLSIIEVKHNIFTLPLRRMCLLTWREFPVLPEIGLFSHGTPFSAHLHPMTESFEVDKETILLLTEYNFKSALAITNKEFMCPVRDTPYFLVPLITDHSADIEKTLSACREKIDWEEIKRTAAYQFTAIDPSSETFCLKDAIVTDAADGHRPYYVVEVAKHMHPFSTVSEQDTVREIGFTTYADFYKEVLSLEVSMPDQPMLRVQKINRTMNYLQYIHGNPPKVKARTAQWVIPEFCHLHPISASVYQSLILIPSITTRVDAFLLVREARDRYALPIYDVMMLEAYTTPSANMKMNYERLETLGDSLLKLIATIRLYINFPLCNEGELHCLRIRVICNRALYRAAKRLRLYRYVTSHTFNRRYWRPHHFVTANDTMDTLKEVRTHMLSDKTLADVVEASLGAAYLDTGLEGGLLTAIAMQIPFDEIREWKDFMPTYLNSRKSVPPRAEIKALRCVSLPRVYELTGYTFQQPLLVVEALTHASLPNSTAPCYQRLEFLGDAILDFLVIRYLFEKYPDYDPGMITEIKDSCVNNHVLGIICIETRMHTHIIHYSSRLIKAIEEFDRQVQDMKKSGEAVGEYWRDMSIPKVLSDIVESMLGAVFVDSGFDIRPVEALFRLWIQPIFDEYVTPDKIKIHPLRKLTTDLQKFGCEGFMLRNHTTTGTGPTSQKCVIFLHEKPLACGAGDNVKAARRAAAHKANQRLEDEPELLMRICNCSIHMRYVQEEKEEEERLEKERLEKEAEAEVEVQIQAEAKEPVQETVQETVQELIQAQA